MNRLERDQYLKGTAAFLTAQYGYSDKEAYALLKKHEIKRQFENDPDKLLEIPPKELAGLLIREEDLF